MWKISKTKTKRSCKQIAELLDAKDASVVFAESCTAGLVSATLAQVPGISKRLCGSFVAYQISQKIEGLGVSEKIIKEHTAESRETALAMADCAMQLSPNAKIALSIVGHLGPNAPSSEDGVVYVGVHNLLRSTSTKCCHNWHKTKLKSISRTGRMREAASFAIDCLLTELQR
jgi:nicotinamide-nucleotide amidase